MTPALTSSSLNFPISVRSFSSGMTPASESLVALTIIMKRMAISFQVNELDTQEDLLHIQWSNGRMPIRQGAENSFPVAVKPERQGEQGAAGQDDFQCEIGKKFHLRLLCC